MSRKVISLKDVKNALAEGKKELIIDRDTVLTPSAKDVALTGAIRIVVADSPQSPGSCRCDISKARIMEMIKSIAREKNISICEKGIEKVAELVLKNINTGG